MFARSGRRRRGCAALGQSRRIVAVNAIHLDRVPELPYELLWWQRELRSVANVTRADVADFLALAAEVRVPAQIE
jgi:propanol-preferring alcohol dehydrogenase